jgi:hypothetical protein
MIALALTKDELINVIRDLARAAPAGAFDQHTQTCADCIFRLDKPAAVYGYVRDRQHVHVARFSDLRGDGS